MGWHPQSVWFLAEYSPWCLGTLQAFSHLPSEPSPEPWSEVRQSREGRAWPKEHFLWGGLRSGSGLFWTPVLTPCPPQGYGVCSVGLERLAYLLVAYSLGASAASLLGLLGLWLPRPVPLVAGAGVHLLLTFVLFFWAPVPRVLQHSWILYVAAALWGVGSALNKTGLSSEYNCRHWEWGRRGGAGDFMVISGRLAGHRHPRDRYGVPWSHRVLWTWQR